MLTTRERAREDRQLQELERLWDTPAALEPHRPRPSLLDRLPRVPGLFLAVAWTLFFLAVLVFEPAPQEGVATPLWGEIVFGSLMLALLAAAFLGRDFPRFGFGAATVAGALGVVIAVACHTSGHHLGNFWLVELGATAALTAAAATGLADRLRR